MIQLWFRNKYLLVSYWFYKLSQKRKRVDYWWVYVEPLFYWDEAFVPPCCLNQIWCGSFRGKWTTKIQFLGIEMGSDD